MEIGAPRVSVEALVDLHRLLMEHRLRRSFADDSDVVPEARNEEPVTADRKVQATAPTQHGVGFDKAQRNKRRRTKRDNCSLGASLGGGCRRGDQGDQR